MSADLADLLFRPQSVLTNRLATCLRSSRSTQYHADTIKAVCARLRSLTFVHS